jgi:hypothetical protein
VPDTDYAPTDGLSTTEARRGEAGFHRGRPDSAQNQTSDADMMTLCIGARTGIYKIGVKYAWYLKDSPQGGGLWAPIIGLAKRDEKA